VDDGWGDEKPKVVSAEAKVTAKQAMIVDSRGGGSGFGYRRQIELKDVHYTAEDAVGVFMAKAQRRLDRALAEVGRAEAALADALELWAEHEPSTSTTGEPQ
jgi:hypothetical protein